MRRYKRRVERIVMRHERSRRRAAGDRLHHRRLDLREIERVQEATDETNEHAAAPKHLARLLAHDEVDVALPQLHLGVGDAVPLLRQRPQRLREQLELRDVHRQLTGLALDDLAARADDVAQVPLLELAVQLLAEPVALDHQLDLARAVLQSHEADAAADRAWPSGARRRAPSAAPRPAARRCATDTPPATRRRARRAENRSDRRYRPRAAARASRAARRSSRFSGSSLSAIARLLQALLQALLEKIVEIAVEHVLRPRALEIRTQILYARLIENVGADLTAPADVGLAVLDDLRLFSAFLLLELVELGTHLVHRRRAVLVLRALVLALHD